MTAGMSGTEVLPVVVYSAILSSILLFAIGFRVYRPRRATEVAAPAAPASSVYAAAACGDRHRRHGLARGG